MLLLKIIKYFFTPMKSVCHRQFLTPMAPETFIKSAERLYSIKNIGFEAYSNEFTMFTKMNAFKLLKCYYDFDTFMYNSIGYLSRFDTLKVKQANDNFLYVEVVSRSPKIKKLILKCYRQHLVSRTPEKHLEEDMQIFEHYLDYRACTLMNNLANITK